MSSELRSNPQQNRSSQAIEDILDAAERLVDKVGINKLNTVLVAEEAGISVGKVYYWFQDKSSLLTAVEERTQERLTEFLNNSLVEAGDVSTPVLVRSFIGAFFDFCRDHPGTLALLDHQSTSANAHDTFSFRSHMVNLIEVLIAIRVDKSTVRERRLVAELLASSAIAVAGRAMEGDEADHTLMADELSYLVAAYLAARYPYSDDPVWTDETRHIRPARESSAATKINEHVFPVVID